MCTSAVSERHHADTRPPNTRHISTAQPSDPSGLFGVHLKHNRQLDGTAYPYCLIHAVTLFSTFTWRALQYPTHSSGFHLFAPEALAAGLIRPPLPRPDSHSLPPVSVFVCQLISHLELTRTRGVIRDPILRIRWWRERGNHEYVWVNVCLICCMGCY